MANGLILIIEDEVKIAFLLRDYLEREGFKTTCLHHGESAIAAIRKDFPALILLDLMLPGMDGITICREVRKFSDVPVIMITAKIEEVDRLIGLEIGADDYICKPFSPREVAARVKAVLRRARSSVKPRRLEAGHLVLNEQTHQVMAAGVPLSLTPSEFGLLNVLIASPGRVFSRGELLDKVQGYQFDGYDRTVDSHVKNLRRKIAEVLPGQDIITTIYGVGYTLDV